MEEQVQITRAFTHNCFWKIVVHYSIFLLPILGLVNQKVKSIC